MLNGVGDINGAVHFETFKKPVAVLKSPPAIHLEIVSIIPSCRAVIADNILKVEPGE